MKTLSFLLSRILFPALAVVCLAAIQGCDVSQQAQQAYNLANCDFRVRSMENLRLAGIYIQDISGMKSLNLTDAAKIMAAAAGPALPLSFRLNLEGKNPNAAPAGMNRLEYILLIDDIQMTSGVLEKAFTIPAGGTGVIPIDLSFDLKQVLKGKSLDALVNFGFNLAGTGSRPTRIAMKLKPSIMVGGRMLSYPGYITVKTEYSGH